MINKDDIRITKGSYNVDGKYWYYPEIRKKKHSWLFGDRYWWEHVYAVNYNTFSTTYKLESISPHNEYKLQIFLKECYDWVKYYDEQEDWKLVNHEEYERVYNWGLEKRQSYNNNVYLK